MTAAVCRGFIVMEIGQMQDGRKKETQRSRRYHVRSAAEEFHAILSRLEPAVKFRIKNDMGYERKA